MARRTWHPDTDEMPAARTAGIASTDALLRRYAREPTPADLDLLVHRFQPLARSLARRYRLRSVASDDIEQAAYVGLILALQRFDPERGHAFSTYAVPTILGETDPGFELVECRTDIERAIPQLDESERLVLRLRFADERTFAEIGRELSVAPTQAARLARGALRRLRALTIQGPSALTT